MKDWDAYVGVNPSDKFNDISARYSAHEISGINSRYYALDQGEPTFLLSYAEQCFIVAEGILRGWADGDARINYEKGIQAAMSFTAASTPDNATYNHGMKITAPVISAYIESPKVAFGGTTEQKLEKIMQQRYFMGFMQDGWSTYYEYRRTGYPAFPINPQTNLNTDVNRLPSRWMYPDSELSTNRSNLEAAVASQYGGSDDVNQLMWILK
jgi:hypothetical protein